jgi:hypothetical protein
MQACRAKVLVKNSGVCHACLRIKLKGARICSVCKTARYCNVICQRSAWSEHVRECIPRIEALALYSAEQTGRTILQIIVEAANSLDPASATYSARTSLDEKLGAGLYKAGLLAIGDPSKITLIRHRRAWCMSRYQLAVALLEVLSLFVGLAGTGARGALPAPRLDEGLRGRFFEIVWTAAPRGCELQTRQDGDRVCASIAVACGDRVATPSDWIHLVHIAVLRPHK